MKRYAYKDYAEFKKTRPGASRTEADELANIKNCIDELAAQRDYDSINILKDLANLFIDDPTAAAEREAQTKLFFILQKLPQNKKYYSFLDYMLK